MANKIQVRRGTASAWTSANTVLSEGEIGFETDTDKFKIGNGSDHWGDLEYFLDAVGVAGNSYITGNQVITGKTTLTSSANALVDFGVSNNLWLSGNLNVNQNINMTTGTLTVPYLLLMNSGGSANITNLTANTLTVLGNLNTNYEGAEFVLWDQVIPFGEGDVIIFPSNFMYPHLVKDCTKGTRYSFVSWAY